MALVSGEAGIGKTSLVEQFAARRRAPRVLWGACEALSTPHPLGPLHDVAARGRRLRALLARPHDRAAIFTAVLDELAAAPRRRCSCSRTSTGPTRRRSTCVRFLGRRIQRVPALLVLTYRDDELGSLASAARRARRAAGGARHAHRAAAAVAARRSTTLAARGERSAARAATPPPAAIRSSSPRCSPHHGAQRAADGARRGPRPRGPLGRAAARSARPGGDRAARGRARCSTHVAPGGDRAAIEALPASGCSSPTARAALSSRAGARRDRACDAAAARECSCTRACWRRSPRGARPAPGSRGSCTMRRRRRRRGRAALRAAGGRARRIARRAREAARIAAPRCAHADASTRARARAPRGLRVARVRAQRSRRRHPGARRGIALFGRAGDVARGATRWRRLRMLLVRALRNADAARRAGARWRWLEPLRPARELAQAYANGAYLRMLDRDLRRHRWGAAIALAGRSAAGHESPRAHRRRAARIFVDDEQRPRRARARACESRSTLEDGGADFADALHDPRRLSGEVRHFDAPSALADGIAFRRARPRRGRLHGSWQALCGSTAAAGTSRRRADACSHAGPRGRPLPRRAGRARPAAHAAAATRPRPLDEAWPGARSSTRNGSHRSRRRAPSPRGCRATSRRRRGRSRARRSRRRRGTPGSSASSPSGSGGRARGPAPPALRRAASRCRSPATGARPRRVGRARLPLRGSARAGRRRRARAARGAAAARPARRPPLAEPAPRMRDAACARSPRTACTTRATRRSHPARARGAALLAEGLPQRRDRRAPVRLVEDGRPPPRSILAKLERRLAADAVAAARRLGILPQDGQSSATK